MDLLTERYAVRLGHSPPSIERTPERADACMEAMEGIPTKAVAGFVDHMLKALAWRDESRTRDLPPRLGLQQALLVAAARLCREHGLEMGAYA